MLIEDGRKKMDYFETGLLKILLPLSKKNTTAYWTQAVGRRPRCHVGLLRVASPLNGHARVSARVRQERRRGRFVRAASLVLFCTRHILRQAPLRCRIHSFTPADNTSKISLIYAVYRSLGGSKKDILYSFFFTPAK
jgi:hypothetical protein